MALRFWRIYEFAMDTLQNAIFGGQILVLRQQLLVHRPGDVGQDVRPIHNGPLAPTVRRGVIDRPQKKSTGRPPAPLCLAVDN